MTRKGYISDERAGLVTMRDPMIVPDGDTYYLVGTQPPYWEGENAGVHLWKSTDLENWTDCGLILKRADLPENFWGRDRFWAPELFKTTDGKFLLTFNARNESEEHPHTFGVGLAVSDRAAGPYTVITKDEPLTTRFDNAIDGTIFCDDDGKFYLGCNCTDKHLYLSELDAVNGTLGDSIDVCCAGDDGEWDSVGIEGQCIVKRHGIYYQWYSSWTNGYAAGILTADNILGPWKKHPSNPVLSGGGCWYNGGHNHSFRSFDGQDYITFHANLREPDGENVERIFILPVTYTADGNVVIEQD